MSATYTSALTIKKERPFETTNFTDVLFVDSNNTMGPWDGTIDHPFQNISEGVFYASGGDIIYVLNGTYHEQITIGKSLYLLGEDKEGVIIDAKYDNHSIIIDSSNVKIEKFTIINSDGYKGNSGIFIKQDGCEISYCVFYRHRVGVHVLNADSTNINNCTFHTTGKAVVFEKSTNSEIDSCEFAHNGIGVLFQVCSNIKFLNSYAHENAIPILFNHSSNIKIADSAICDNNDNGGGVFVYHSNNVTVDNCNVFHSGSGFKIVNSRDITFTNCNVEYITHFTFWIRDNSKNINILNCNITNNFRHGIHITDSCLTIANSNLYNNKIESILAKKSCVTAKNNWWGSKLGPLFGKGTRFFDLLSLKVGRVKYFPWYSKPLENAGSDWIVKDIFEKTVVTGYGDGLILLDGNDTDSDGVPDWWEEKYGYNSTVWDDHASIDEDGDALNNFEECYTDSYGSNPFEKDVFLEFDWTPTKRPGATNKPPEEYIDEMCQRFAEHDINLHVDLGNLDGGGEIPYITNFSFDELMDLYWDYFIENDLENPRKNIFHYGIICDTGPGNGFMFTGWAHLNAFCISAEVIYANHQNFDRGLMITQGSMHELGHTLGLVADDFEGIDNHACVRPKYIEFWKYLRYRSVMSYLWTYDVLDYSDGEKGKNDFDDWGNMQFDFFKNTCLDWPKT
jgi:parallel beta-helix repeat protein